MVFHLVLSFLQLSFLDGPDPFLDETLYVFLRNISPPRARKSLCGYSHLSVVIFLQVLKRGTVSCTNLLVSSKCSRSLHSPFHRRQWRNVSFTSLSETYLMLVSCTITISRPRFFWSESGSYQHPTTNGFIFSLLNADVARSLPQSGATCGIRPSLCPTCHDLRDM